jgi:DNA-binding transcriptional LysR family regulator
LTTAERDRVSIGRTLSPIYIEHLGKPERIEDLSRHHLVGFDDTLSNRRAAKWLRNVAPQAKMAARTNSVLGLIYAVKSGLGVGPLPISLGDAEPHLVRMLGPVAELSRSWRILISGKHRAYPHFSTS